MANEKKEMTDQEFVKHIANELKGFTDRTGNAVVVELTVRHVDNEKNRAMIDYRVHCGPLGPSGEGYST